MKKACLLQRRGEASGKAEGQDLGSGSEKPAWAGSVPHRAGERRLAATSVAPQDFRPPRGNAGWEQDWEGSCLQPCSKPSSIEPLREKRREIKRENLQVRFTLNSIKPPQAVGK